MWWRGFHFRKHFPQYHILKVNTRIWGVEIMKQMEKWPRKFRRVTWSIGKGLKKAAASCMNNRNTERMVNKGNQMQQRDVERLWSFKGLNLTVLNADGQIWNADDKKNEVLSNSIQLHEEGKVKRDKRVKESSKTNPIWYKHLMEMGAVVEKAAWR